MEQHWVIRVGRVGRLAIGLCLVLSSLSALGQPGPPGQKTQAEADRVIEAHRAVQSATVQASYGLYFARPDETEFVTSQYRIVFDRPTKRVRIDRPGYTLVSDGKEIYLVADALPGRHLRVPLTGELTYESLVAVFPDLADPTPPVLVYLFSEEPVAKFVVEEAGAPSALADTDRQTHLAYPLAQGSHKHSFQKKSLLMEQMLVHLDLNQPDLTAVRFHYGFEWSAIDQPVDDDAFKLDLKQSHEFTTLAAFLSPNGGNAQQNPGAGQPGQGGGVAAGNSLVGMPLPEIELEQLGGDKKVKLSELDEGVVILECFATWSKTSVLDLPALVEFKAWCEEEKHDVKVYGVAVGEQAEHMTKWMDALEKTAKKEIDLPVLLDTSTEAAVAMKLPTVPRTMVVVDGRVVDVFGGVKPTYLDDLKKGMPQWLEKVAEQKEDEEEDGEE